MICYKYVILSTRQHLTFQVRDVSCSICTRWATFFPNEFKRNKSWFFSLSVPQLFTSEPIRCPAPEGSQLTSSAWLVCTLFFLWPVFHLFPGKYLLIMLQAQPGCQPLQEAPLGLPDGVIVSLSMLVLALKVLTLLYCNHRLLCCPSWFGHREMSKHLIKYLVHESKWDEWVQYKEGSRRYIYCPCNPKERSKNCIAFSEAKIEGHIQAGGHPPVAASLAAKPGTILPTTVSAISGYSL